MANTTDITQILIERLRKGEQLSYKDIKTIYLNKDKWNDSSLFLQLAKRALALGENFFAYDMAEQIPENEDGKPDIAKIHIMAVALARSGSWHKADELISMLPQIHDSEIIGLKSRIFKDLAMASSGSEAVTLFEKAGMLSLQIFNSQKKYYNGINAASCLFMAGQTDTARKLVQQEIIPICNKEYDGSMWLEATLGECELLLGHFNKAVQHYANAVNLAGLDFGNLGSTIRQLNMLINRIGGDANNIIAQLGLPSIAVFSGHMIDRPGRKIPRFPPSAIPQVTRELADIINKHKILVSYSSCACGGDIIFMEEVLNAGGKCYIVPPQNMKDTIASSVDVIPDSDWSRRLQDIIQNPNAVLLEPECEIIPQGDNVSYQFCNEYMLGLALLKAKSTSFNLLGVTVWNGEKSNLNGGTDSAVELWNNHNLQLAIVKPDTNIP